MNSEDMFLKVEFTAYFSVNGLRIEKKEFANDPDSNGIYLKNKRIVPDIEYFLLENDGETYRQVELPKSMHLELDRSSYNEEFVTRAQIWKEDPGARHLDEMIEDTFSRNSESN